MWLKQQEILEMLEREEVERQNILENEKWLRAEKVAMNNWVKHLENIELLNKERLLLQSRLLEEKELEEQGKEKERELLKKLKEENEIKQKIFMENLESFLSGDLEEPPDELQVWRETRPNNEECPFFFKTGCCRFSDKCSRNHRYPGISKILLATNFYTHFGLENTNSNEYDTDVMLEYDDIETYNEFKEFFYDVLTEFEKFGKVVQFVVCNNHEKHLRGNVYIEFSEIRSSVAAYRSLHTRWYGGRQLSLQFCYISSWRNAVCGLQSRKKCPKGRACNFLHIFRNPNYILTNFANSESSQNNLLESSNRKSRSKRSWRWSESPELELRPVKSSKRKDHKQTSSGSNKKSPKKRKHSHRRDENRR